MIIIIIFFLQDDQSGDELSASTDNLVEAGNTKVSPEEFITLFNGINILKTWCTFFFFLNEIHRFYFLTGEKTRIRWEVSKDAQNNWTGNRFIFAQH